MTSPQVSSRAYTAAQTSHTERPATPSSLGIPENGEDAHGTALDTDRDGMPDAWESQHALNPADPADGPTDRDNDGYTNLEEFLNATDPTVYVDYNDPANNRFSWEIKSINQK